MIYLIPIIGLPLAMIIAIKIDIAYKEKKRKRVMKSMYDFWHDAQHYFYTLFCNVFKCCTNVLYNKFKAINYGRNIKYYDYVFDNNLLRNKN